MRRTVYGSGLYLEHRMQWNLSEREANQRAAAIRTRLLKRGLKPKQIWECDLDNPFMTEDARKILVKLAQQK